MTFLRIGISSFFLFAPGIAYFAGMDMTVVAGLAVAGLWGLISVAGEGALGLHHLDAYGPLSPYNDDGDELTTTGKIAGGVVALLAAVFLFFAASSYISKKNNPPIPVPTSSPESTPTTDATPDSTPEPVASKTPGVKVTPKTSPSPVVEASPVTTASPDPASTPAPVASASPEDPEFEKLKLKAEDTVLSRDYKGAAVILDKLEKQAPNDVEVLFFRFLTHQGLDEDEKAKEYADRILKDHPGSRYQRRLNKFLKGLEFAKKREKLGGHPTSVYAIEKGTSIELESTALMAEASDGSLDEVTGSQIGLELIGPNPEVKPISLRNRTKVTPLKSVHFFLRVNSGEFAWEKSRNTVGAAEVDLVFVKVTNGNHKGKRGWIVNNLRGVKSSEDSPSRNRKNILGLPVIR